MRSVEDRIERLGKALDDLSAGKKIQLFNAEGTTIELKETGRRFSKRLEVNEIYASDEDKRSSKEWSNNKVNNETTCIVKACLSYLKENGVNLNYSPISGILILENNNFPENSKLEYIAKCLVQADIILSCHTNPDDRTIAFGELKDLTRCMSANKVEGNNQSKIASNKRTNPIITSIYEQLKTKRVLHDLKPKELWEQFQSILMNDYADDIEDFELKGPKNNIQKQIITFTIYSQREEDENGKSKNGGTFEPVEIKYPAFTKRLNRKK